MKLVMLFVCASLCAHYVISSPVGLSIPPRQFIDYQPTLGSRASFWDTFQTFVNNIIQDATNYLKEYAEKASAIISGIQDQIQGIGSVANATVQDIEKNVKQLMQSLQNQTEIAKNCTEKYGPLMNQVMMVYQQESSICIQNASEAVNQISTAIKPSIDQMLAYIKALQTLVETCFRNSSNIFEGISCVFGKGNEIQTNIVKLVGEIKTIITISSNRGLELVKVTGKCLNSAVDKYQQDIGKLQIEYKNCVLSGFW